MTRLRWASAWRRSRRRWARRASGTTPSSAAAVSAEHARASRRLEGFAALSSDVEDLDALVEMAAEEQSLQAEVDEQIASVEARLAELEEQRLFSGSYDAGDALVTVNAGAGGTDAQDWAEMVLRMEMRWAERRGFSGRAAGGERGRGSGDQVGDVPRVGRERLRPVRRRARRAPARAPVAVRLGAPPPDELRGRRGRAGRGGHAARSRSTRTTCRSTPTAPRAPAASTSTRPTRRCASRTARAGSSCSARTSARSPPTARPRWRCCARSCWSARARTPGGDRAREGRGAGRQLRLADPLLRAAPVHDGQGPPHRRTRWATCSACSTATSTASCAPTCWPRRRRSGASGGRAAARWSQRALREDVGAGDVTTAATVAERRRARGR